MPDGSTDTLIVPGFIARTPEGVQTTLGRNGSDFSASIFGDVLNASEIHIWTDVDGVLSADPRRVPDATVIDSLSYHEAMELAYFGAKVIHPQTMAPAVTKGIPIWVRNTFAAEKPGTLICAAPESTHAVKGITSIDAVALVNVEGAGMIGVPGTAQRLFGALREDGITVILISQGSSEHSICFAVPEKDAARTAETVRRAFAVELRDGQIQDVDALTGHSILQRGRRRHGGHARHRRRRVRRAGRRRRQRARHRAGLVRAQHLGGHRRAGRPRARCDRCTRGSTCRRTPSRSAWSGPAWWAACCSSRSRRRRRACCATSGSTCACAR